MASQLMCLVPISRNVFGSRRAKFNVYKSARNFAAKLAWFLLPMKLSFSCAPML